MQPLTCPELLPWGHRARQSPHQPSLTVIPLQKAVKSLDRVFAYPGCNALRAQTAFPRGWRGSVGRVGDAQLRDAHKGAEPRGWLSARLREASRLFSVAKWFNAGCARGPALGEQGVMGSLLSPVPAEAERGGEGQFPLRGTGSTPGCSMAATRCPAVSRRRGAVWPLERAVCLRFREVLLRVPLCSLLT